MDRKATLRAKQYPGKSKSRLTLPALREGKASSPNATAKDGKERLQKLISTAGLCSRRKAEELILLGQVKVNGVVVNTLGAKADPQEDVIQVEERTLDFGGEKLYYLLNKPRGYITSTEDPQGRPTVMDLMRTVSTRIYPVGRLDFASEGLLLLTNDGALAHKVMHPSTEVVRTYAVKVKGSVTDDQIRQLRKGIQLSDGFVKPLKVIRGDRLENKEWIEIQLTEGKNLEIRRLFAVLDLEVDRLRRIALGSLHIDMVPVGKFLKLSKRDAERVLESKSAEK